MKLRLPPFLILVGIAAACVAVILTVATLRSRALSTEELLQRLPTDNAVVAYVDFSALRDTGVLGLLSGTPVDREPEYRAFVDQTGFDYTQDLDSALVSFHRQGTFMLLRGRFDWKALKQYVAKQGGQCTNLTCRLEGSTKDRKISFFPLQQNVMALSVSDDESKVDVLKVKGPRPAFEAPSRPLWVVVPPSTLSAGDKLPSGTRMFARPLHNAEQIVLSTGGDPKHMEIYLDVVCRSASDASLLAGQLSAATELLRAMIAKENKAPNPQDLSGLLASGSFSHQDRKVFGRWPLEAGFLQSLGSNAAL